MLDHRLGLGLLDALGLLHLLRQFALIFPELADGILELSVIVQHVTHIIHIVLRNNCNAKREITFIGTECNWLSELARLTLQEGYQVEQLSVVVVSVPARNGERVVWMHLRGIVVPVDDNNLPEKEKNPD